LVLGGLFYLEVNASILDNGPKAEKTWKENTFWDIGWVEGKVIFKASLYFRTMVGKVIFKATFLKNVLHLF
jgi:hypothetical protein